MFNDTTLGDLMKRALAYAEYPKDSLDEDQQAQLINDINDGLIELWEVIVDSREELINSSYTFSLVSGTESYALPTDFYKALKLFYVSNDRRYPIARFNLEEVAGFPKPLSSGSIELWYAPRCVRMKNKKAQVSSLIPIGWENYAALFAASRLIGTEGTDGSWVSQERDRLIQRITEHIGDRDATADRIGDVSGRWRDARALYDLQARELRYRIVGNLVYFIELLEGV